MGRYYALVLSIMLSFMLSPMIVSTTGKSYPTPVDVDGEVHVWPLTAESKTVYYEVAMQDETLRSVLSGIVDASAHLWNNVERAAITLEPASANHAANITVNYDTSIAGGDTSAGYTIFDQLEAGVPVHCSIHIAADESSLDQSIDKTTLHELGHCLGLGHSLIAQSIMSYQLEVNSFQLSLDDDAALSRLYPLNSSGPKLAPGCAITGASQAGGQPTEIIALLLAPLVLCLGQRITGRGLRN
jgi:Matrixin